MTEVANAGTQQARRPIWLLDIDGVLNAVQVQPDLGFTRISPAGPVTYRPAVMRRIRELHDAGVVEIRWLTTWMDRAQLLASAVPDLPDNLPVEGHRWFRKPVSWWKANAARDVVEANPDRLVIWTDDDLNSAAFGELDWTVGKPMLRLSPDPRYGLTDEDLDVISRAITTSEYEIAENCVCPGGWQNCLQRGCPACWGTDTLEEPPRCDLEAEGY